MRPALTAFAVLVILALTAALIGPRFVDWGQQRDAVEAQLSRVLGQQVKVRGAIDLNLLPSPTMNLGQVEIVDPQSGIVFSCEKAAMELGLTSLARGQFRFTEASFEHPVLDLARSPDGEILAPRLTLATRSDSIAIEKVVIRSGRIRITAAAGIGRLDIGPIDLDAEVDSLQGPFKGSGQAPGPGEAKLAFHFATGLFEKGELPVKAVIESGAAQPRGEFDGALAFAKANTAADAVAASYAGAASFSGEIKGVEAPTAWRATGVLRADLRTASMSNLEVRLGPEDRALAANGSADATFGAAPHANITLAAKQLNVDALLRREGEDSAPPSRAYEALSAALAGLSIDNGPPIALAVDLAAPSAILGGDTIGDISVSLKGEPAAPIAGRLEASPPGGSHIIASGAFDLGPAPGFKGHVEARAEDAPRLREWLTLGAPELDARLAAIGDVLPYRSAAATGEMQISGAGVAAQNLSLALERSTFTGAAAITRAVGAERARIFANLRTESFDLDALPNVAASGDLLADTDLSLALEASAIRVARLGEGHVESGALKLKLTKQGDEIRLDRLSIADLGGASVEASGAADPKGRWLRATIDATMLRDFALLARRVAPAPISDWLVERAGVLSPVRMTFNAQASGPSGDIAALPDTLVAQGVAGVTRIDAKFDRQPGEAGVLNATFSLDAPDAAPLLRQIGLPALSLAGLGRGHIAGSLHRRLGEEIEGDVSASFAGVDFSCRGRLSLPAAETLDAPSFEGAGSVKGANATPLLAVLGVASADASFAAATDLAADVAWRDGAFSFSRLKGAVGRAHFSGDLAYRPAVAQPVALPSLDPDVALAQAVAGGNAAALAPQPQLQGALSVDRLPLAALSGLALGAPQPAKAGALWSDAKFSAGLANAPASEVGLKIGVLDISDALAAHDASLRVTLGRGLVSLDDMAMTIAGDALTGRVAIRRDGPNASLTGRLSAEPLAIDRPSFAGRLAGAMDFAATGQSASALVAGLAGSGQIQIAGARIPHLDQGALGRIVEKAQSSDYAIDATNISHALDLELNRQPLAVPDATTPALLTAGVLRLGPIEARGAKDVATLDASFDIRSFVLTVHAAFAELQATKFWSGAPPSINVALKGPLEAPAREIDSSLLTAGLAAQAIARETERIAALESDIRERAFFNRRLKADQFLRRRELELDAYALEQARLKSEQDRQRVEADAVKAYGEKRREAAPEPAAAAPPAAAPAPRDYLQPSTSAFSPPLPPPLPSPRPSQPNDPTATGLY